MRIVEVIPQEEDWAFWFSARQVEVPQYAVDDLRKRLHDGALWEGFPWASVAYSSPFKVTLRGEGKAERYVSMLKTDSTGRTPWDYAKAHLKAAFRLIFPLGKRRYNMEAWEAMRKGAYAPQYAMPGHYPNMAYVDIRGAYYSLYSIYWATEYYPKRFLGRYSVFPLWHPELRENKLARNALWGIARATRITLYTRDKGLRVIVAPHSLSYPQAVLGTTDVLHTIAHYAVHDFGAVYVMTDGYIIPRKNAGAFLNFLREMGVHGRIEEEGDAWIGGVGVYRIGAKASRRVARKPLAVDIIRHFVADWLMPRHKWMLGVLHYELGGSLESYIWRPLGEEETLPPDLEGL